VLIVAVPLGVIVWQYARRGTRVALALLASGVAAYSMLVAVTPEQALAERSFPLLASGQHLLQASFGPDKPNRSRNLAEDNEKAKVVWLQLPILAPYEQAGQANSYEFSLSVMEVKGYRLTVEAPGEKPWDSGWRSDETLLTPGKNAFFLRIAIKREIFNRIQSSPAKLRLALAVDLYEAAEVSRAVASKQEFKLDGAGRCALTNYFYGTMLTCRAPFTARRELLVKTPIAASTCNPQSARSQTVKDNSVTPAAGAAYAWSRDGSSGTINPVRTFVLDFRGKRAPSWAAEPQPVCSGTPLVFGRPERTRRGSVEMSADGIKLEEYQIDRKFSF
jgi:hypothetical protein